MRMKLANIICKQTAQDLGWTQGGRDGLAKLTILRRSFAQAAAGRPSASPQVASYLTILRKSEKMTEAEGLRQTGRHFAGWFRSAISNEYNYSI